MARTDTSNFKIKYIDFPEEMRHLKNYTSEDDEIVYMNKTVKNNNINKKCAHFTVEVMIYENP